ncbi:hypothetical protein GCM10020220_045600 [Nonomuraea rubra]
MVGHPRPRRQDLLQHAGARLRSYSGLRTRTKAPLNYFLGFPIDRDIPRHTGILDAEECSAASPLPGRGVGGGSLVNGGMAVTPKRRELRRRSGSVPPAR